MAFPISMLLGPLAKQAGLPTAGDLWANRSRGPIGSPAWQAQQDAGAHPGFGEDLSFKTNTPWGIQNSDPGYWQLPYRDVRKRSKQDWAKPDPNFLFVNQATGEKTPVPVELQPQEPSKFAKAIGAPGVPSSSGFDPRGDSSIYAGTDHREAVKQGVAASGGTKRVISHGDKGTSFYVPGNDQVGSTNLKSAEEVAKRNAPLADDTSLNEGQQEEKSNGGK